MPPPVQPDSKVTLVNEIKVTQYFKNLTSFPDPPKYMSDEIAFAPPNFFWASSAEEPELAAPEDER